MLNGSAFQTVDFSGIVDNMKYITLPKDYSETLDGFLILIVELL